MAGTEELHIMQISAFTINAFAKTPEGGNPAGVVFDADELSVVHMKRIAAALKLSETAFVMKSNVADFEVRFFTPTDEVDLCGHATIGAFAVMLDQKRIQPGLYSQQTRAGLLSVEVRSDGLIMMNQTTPDFAESVDKNMIADSLNIPLDVLSEDLPVQIVSTGLRDIIVPVRSLEELNAIRPDFAKVTKISREFRAVGYHIFTTESLDRSTVSVNGSTESLDRSTAHCRNLAPLYGIPEESATGTASGALACYLFRHRKIEQQHDDNQKKDANEQQSFNQKKDANENQSGNQQQENKQHQGGDQRKDANQRLEYGDMVFEQGYSMGRPSEIHASLRIEGDDIQEVKVGGIAMNLQRVEFTI